MSSMMSPDLSALLSGGGQPPVPEQSEGSGPLDILRAALAKVREYIQQENDEANILEAEKVTTVLQKLLADEQKEKDDAMMGKASPRLLRNTYGG